MSGKLAYVTGGMGGIGTSICQRLAKEGFRVVAGCGPSRNYQQWLDEQAAQGYTFHASVGNVSDWDSTVAAFERITAELGQVDVLVNNAGITRDGLIARMSEDQYDSVVNVNQKGVFNMIRHVTPVMMKQRSGRIVSMASVSGLYGNAGQLNYSASKAAIVGMTKTAAKELGGRGITVNAVAPGFIQTDMTAKLSDKAKEAILGGVALKRMGQPEDVANAVAFLASDAAGYITGQVLVVDGGMGQ